MLRTARLRPAVIPALVAVVIVLLLCQDHRFDVPMLGRIEAITYDARMRLAARLAPIPRNPDVVLVGIDEESLLAYGRWPWPRQAWADVIDALSELGAKAVLLDVVFPEPTNALVETRFGRLTLQEAVRVNHMTSRSMLMDALDATTATSSTADLRSRIDVTLTQLSSELTHLVPQADTLVGDSLLLARRSGVVTAGVVTVPDLGSAEQASHARDLTRARKWITEQAGRSASQLDPALTRSLGSDIAHLDDYAAVYARLKDDPNPNLFSEDIPQKVREWFRKHFWDVRQDVLADRVRDHVGTADPLAMDVETVYREGVGEGFRRIGTFSRTVFERTLGRLLIERHHIAKVQGLELLPQIPWILETHPMVVAIARGMSALGSDREIKDSDGAFRSVPLLLATPEGTFLHGGLALYMQLLDRSGAWRNTGLRVIPGPQLEITRPGRPPLRVPVDRAGHLMVSWAGGYKDSFDHLGIHALLNYAGIGRDRENFFELLGKNPIYRQTIELRQVARRAAVSSEKATLTLEQLGEAFRREWPARRTDLGAYVLDRANDPVTRSRLQSIGAPASTTTPLDVTVWGEILTRFQGLSELQAIQRHALSLQAINRIKDPRARAKRMAAHQQVAHSFAEYVDRRRQLRESLEAKVKGKVCVVGMTAHSGTDLSAMPFEPAYPKVGSYANVYDQLDQGRFIFRPEAPFGSLGGLVDPRSVQIPLLVLCCLGMGLALGATGGRGGNVLAATLLASWAAVSVVAFVYARVWLDMAAPLAGMTITAAIVFMRRAVEATEIRTMFESYVDKRIVEVIVSNRELWRELGGREHTITAFFSDIAGFTTLSELLGAQDVAAMLTDYLSPMTDLILSHEGTRDKYIGDAIVAFWGAPIEEAGHEGRAVLSSIAQQEMLIELRARWIADGVPWYRKVREAGHELEFRIGLNTGLAKVGNFGSRSSRNYTMIGDTVNLASRLEGANKEYGSRIMVSEATLAGCRDLVVARPLDLLVVKGKAEAVKVFEIVGRRGAVAPVWNTFLPLFLEAMHRYYPVRDFAGALALFEKCLEIIPTDECTRLYVDRCSTCITTPPPDDWNGSFVMTHK